MAWSDIYLRIRVISSGWWRNIQNYKFRVKVILQKKMYFLKSFKLLKTINLLMFLITKLDMTNVLKLIKNK